MSTQEIDQRDTTSVPEGAPACGGYACCVPTDADPSNSTCPTEEGCSEGELNGFTGGDPLQRMLSGMVADMLGNIGKRYQEDCDDTDGTGSESSESTDAGDAECVEIYDDAQLHLLLEAHLELVRAVCSRRR